MGLYASADRHGLSKSASSLAAGGVSLCAQAGRLCLDGRRERMTSGVGNERDTVVETIAIFSDRLRTPLTAVWAQVAMLLDGDYGSLSSEQRQALEVAQRNSTRLLQVIEDAEQSLARAAQNPGEGPSPRRG